MNGVADVQATRLEQLMGSTSMSCCRIYGGMFYGA